jgi:hypothetical protein
VKFLNWLYTNWGSLQSETFDSNVKSNVKNMRLDGDNYYPRSFDVTAPGWLETEARYAVDEITEQIRSDVHLSPDINYKSYPNPADAMRATAIDLTNKIKAKESRYVDKARYYSGGKYSSCSAKTISQVREWYVDEVLHQVNEQYMAAVGNIDGEIDADFSDSADDVRNANKNGADLLKDALSFPIGLTMRAEHVRDDGSKYEVDDIAYWEENVTLGVDMEPDYLLEDSDGGKKLINLGVQNVCSFGPTGIPVLPPPNYVVQFNSWMINVEGRIDGFTLVDADNEVHPNPMFGHEAQVFKRNKFRTRDPTSDSIIGENLPIEFSFSTGTFIAVPPTGRPIGDRLDGLTETSSEYSNILGKYMYHARLLCYISTNLNKINKNILIICICSLVIFRE